MHQIFHPPYNKNVLSLFLLITCLLPSIGHAQIIKRYLDVHPVRVNHKWGYVKIYPTLVDTIISPKYDFLGDVNMPYNKITNDGAASPYKVFDLDGKVGLLNSELQEVVSNQYNQIKVVSNDFFAVSQDRQFQLVDQTGAIYFDSTKFENICLADGGSIGQTSYFYTKKKGQWGISRIPNDEEIVPSKYELIEQAGHAGYYKVKEKNNTYWDLIDTTGQRLLPKKFKDIIVLDEQHYAVLELTNWFIYKQEKGKLTKQKEAYTYIKKVNKYLTLAVPYTTKKAETADLWNLSKDTLLHTFRNFTISSKNDQEENYGYFCQPLDDDYAIKFDRSSYHLINALGKKVSPFFYTIEATSQANIYLAKRGGFGLMQKLVEQDTFISSEYIYSDIFNIKNDLAISTQNGNYGVIGITPDSFPSIPCNYTAIPQIYGDSILLQFNSNVFNYIFDREGAFVPKPVIYEETLLIPKAVKRTLREAPAIRFKRYQAYQPKWIDYQIQGDSMVTKDTIRDASGRPIRNRATRRVSTRYKAILHLDSSQKAKRPAVTEEILSTFHSVHLGKEIDLSPSYLSTILPATATSFQLYDNVKNQPIKVPKMIGLRHFNEESAVSSFIAPDGKMGIINKNGQELTRDRQPIRYTYIGPFIAGRARVCSGGTIVFDVERDLPLPPKFSMGNAFEFLIDFRMPYAGEIDEEKAGIKYFLKSLPNSPIEWSYIDTRGNVIIETDFDYIEDFHARDNAALFLKEIDKEVYKGTGKNDAVYGVINDRGQIKVPPIYSQISILKDFYVVQKKGTPTFTFNQEGHEIIINPTKPSGFSEERAQIKNAARLIGYINKAGARIIPAQYKLARNFSSGNALVIDTLDQYSFIDKDGQTVFAIDVKNPLLVSDFKEGYTWVKKSGKSSFWQCIDQQGKIAFKRSAHYQINKVDKSVATNYFVPMSFSNGLASVVIVDTISRKLVSAIIDTTGKVLHQFKQQLTIEAFNADGKAIFEGANGKGVLDSIGKIWISPKYKAILPFQTGAWKVQTKQELWGVINNAGQQIIRAKYIRMADLSEGKVAVKENNYDGWFYINASGKLVIKGPFRNAEPFKVGYATVEKKGVEYIINTAGEKVNIEGTEPLFFSEELFGLLYESTFKPFKKQYFADDTGANLFGRFFQEITPFQQGIARVKRLEKEEGKKELFGAINKRGVMIVAPKFKNLHIQPDGTVIINPQQYFGLLDKAGKVLIEPQFDKIEQFREFNIFRVERGESVGYVRIKDGECHWVWELQK